MTTTDFIPVRPIYDGGTGIPVPIYLATYRGHTLHVFHQGEMGAALDWLKGRDYLAAIVCQIDGVRREVGRGTLRPALV